MHVSERANVCPLGHHRLAMHRTPIKKSEAGTRPCCVCTHFPAWKPIAQLRRNAKKEKKEKKSRGERKRHQSYARPYWRAQSPSACGGRAAASTPRPSAAGPGPSLPARREPPRSPGPGARTLAARPPAPGWQDVPLGPPDSQLGNTNVRGKRIKLCNLLVDRGISMTDVAVIFLFTFLVFYMPYNHLR